MSGDPQIPTLVDLRRLDTKLDRIDRLDSRLDRMERRLDLAEA
jgi:hypothetical protein